MKIEDQVCTLEQAKKLTELLIDCSSFFEYARFESEEPFKLVRHIDAGESVESHPAFTVAELGLMLQSHNNVIFWPVWGEFCYKDLSGQPRGYSSEAHARACWLIELLEDGKITIEEVNQRLQE